MNQKQTYFDWSLGWQWLLSCALGTAVFGLAAYASMWQIGETVGQTNDLVRVAVAGALFGAFLALGGTLGPGLLLRRLGVSAGRWIGYSVLAAAVAMSSGVTLIFSQSYPIEQIVSAVFVGLALGLPMGLIQAHLLKRQGIAAALWPLITIIAYTLSFGVVVFFGGEGREGIVLGGMGLILGMITALGMMWLLRQDTAVAL